MKITKELLDSHNACEEGLEWVTEHKLIDLEHAEFIDYLIKREKLDWANWLIVRLLSKDNRVKYAIYAAELVLHIFEDKYPEDDRPGKALEAAKEYF